MRWFLRLFSIYLFALSGIACSADDGCCPEEQLVSNAQQLMGPSSHPLEKESAGLPCSPLFACCAMQGIVLPNDNLGMLLPILPYQRSYCREAQAIVSRFIKANWQPPKLVA
ncbi:MAG TPA: hypothetical protein VL307_11560 [Chitinophagaceae bacterium]|nr:hypothetical protein [Chitinophagaceae bacterium]